MEIRAAEASVSPATEFVRWEEVFISTDKGRREVHYNLKRMDGSSDLAVIGKERSLRHMSYHYAIQDTSLLSVSSSSSSSRTKLKSRRDVVDWLNSIVTDSHPPLLAVGSLDCKDTCEVDVKSFKKQEQHTKKFLWVGSPWICEKRRRHYPSFIRNGVKISVHDFVYVLAEEDKRLVAYLKDLYEDSKGNKMVMVQWFHKIDEVGIILPHSFNDREIFFSLCTQRLSIECIDGLATVLCPMQFEKYMNEATHSQLDPFVCHNQFDNGELKPFDITQIKGYWNQEILRVMCTASPSNAYKSQPYDGLNTEDNFNRAIGIRPKKKQRQSKGNDVFVQCSEGELMDVPVLDARNLNKSSSYCESGELIDVSVRDADYLNKIRTYFNNPTDVSTLKGGGSAASLSRIVAIKHKPTQYVAVGSQVEVLSQDSGIRGCWFRGLIIKKHNDRVKVRYLDLKDAENEANNVEEWILSSKVAASDKLGMRSNERKTIRPVPRSNKEGRVSWVVDVGTAVDAWWHDGWWEGLVIQKEAEDKIHVYFPGEKQEAVFTRDDLRHSQEWVENRWNHIKDRPELVTEIISNLEAKQVVGNSYDDGKVTQDALGDSCQQVKNNTLYSNLHADSGNDKGKELEVISDLSKDDLLTQLKWKSRKRRRGTGSSVQKLDYNDSNSKRSPEAICSRTYERLSIPSSLKVDLDNCKYIDESLFSTSAVPHLTSMVMSR